MRDSYALYVDQLNGEYKEVFKQVEIYVSTQNVDEDTKEANMGELLDTFLNAQKEGRLVEEIVGNDMESFCKNFCSEFTWENKAMNIVETWRNAAWLIFVLETLDVIFIIIGVLLGEQPISDLWATESTFNLTGYMMGFVIVGLIFTVIDYITRKVMFKLKKKSVVSKIWTGIIVVVLICSFFIIFFMMGNGSLNFLVLPSWVLAVASGLFLAGYYIINRDRVKERKANKVSFFGMVQAEMDADFPSQFEIEMEKQFIKKNKRLAKKGKQTLTKEEFVNLREEEMKKTLKWKWLYDWAPLIVTVPMGIVEYLMNGFSVDLILYVAILFACEFFVLKGMWKLVSSAVKTNMTWIEAQRKKLNGEE